LFNRELAQIVLEKQGHKVTTATNGLKALELLTQKSFDIILMDIQMPEMDGLTATNIIRRCEVESEPPSSKHKEIVEMVWRNIKGTRTPIAAMTANAMSGDHEKCIKGGMDDYTTKPFQPEDLSALLVRLIDKKRSASIK